jgi:tight adherence protein B
VRSAGRSISKLALVGLALAALALPAAASASVRLHGIDTSNYPTVRATVFSSAGPSIRPALTEDGTAVTALNALNLANSKSVVLAIDRSQSMHGAKFANAISAAREFVASKPASDGVAVLAFSSNVLAVSRFSQNPGDSDSALQSLRLDRHQGTALYDGVEAAVGQLATQSGARVLILLTDGADTTSRHSLDAAAQDARRHNVLVYSIGISGDGFTPDALERLAEDSGGAFYRADSSSALADVYRSIAAALRGTWRVEYVTAARPGELIRLQAAVAGAGTGSASTRIPTSIGSVAAPPPSKIVPPGAYGPSGPLALGIAVAMLTLLAFVLIFAAYRGSWVRSRIAAHIGETKATAKEKRQAQRLAAFQAIFRATEGAFGNLKQWRWVQRMLERGAIPLRTVEFFWIMIGSAFVLGFFGAVAGQSPFFILLLMALGGGIPLFWAWFKMRRRLKAFENQLPDLLITIAASLKAGHSFKQGLQAVVEEGMPPASDEFGRVLTETQLGRPMDEALADMAERCGSKNFEFAITAVTIQRQVGGSLASLFDMVADTVRQRQQFARKIRGLTAMGRMGSYTLVGIPFFLAVALTVMNPTYMHPLYHTKAGHFMIALGFVMMAMGAALLKKIVSFRG